MTLGDEIVQLATTGLGFALGGVCEAAPTSYRDHLDDWLGAGKHAEMGWLVDNVDVRADPRVFLPGCRSLIMVADQYHTRNDPPDEMRAGVGRVARYARGDDYHRVMKKRVHELCDQLRGRFPEETFRAFVDTAPVLEREHAARAGLGWVGKHTLLIHPERGSWLVLGGIATTLAIEPPAGQAAVDDHCGTCARCIEACPTGAITPHSVDASRCISYLTIEHRSAIDAELGAAFGDWLFGCDICQEVCPHNSPRDLAGGVEIGERYAAYEPRRTGFELLEVLGWSEDDRRAALTRSAMKRAKLEMWRRNAETVRRGG
ncbi:MAG: tRNA epoxyqueuosine(34) reductase QueG [Planctomycetota bacterium]